MSAPKTDVEKQKKRHKGPLSGMGLVVAFALVLLAGFAIYVASRGNEPADSQPIGAEGGGAATEQVQEAQGADAQQD